MSKYIYGPRIIMKKSFIFEREKKCHFSTEIIPKLEVSFRSADVCYTARINENIPFDFEKVTSSGPLEGSLTQQEINLKLIEFGSIRIKTHSRNTFPRGYESSYAIDYKSEEKFYLLLLERQLVNLLPPPYQSNCLEYRSIGFESRAHALDNCSLDLAIKHGYLCCHSLVTEDLITDNLVWFSEINRKHLLEEKKYKKRCLEKYVQPDCYQERITATLYFKTYKSNELNFHVEFYIQYYDIISTAISKLFIVDYLIQFGSIIAFWFGLSLHLKNQIFEIFDLILNQYYNF